MNKLSTKLVAIVFIAAITMSALPLARADGSLPTPPAFYIQPFGEHFTTNTLPVGNKFNVTVYISTTTAIFTWQAKVTFDPTQLQAVRADYTGVGKSVFLTGHSTVPVSPVINNVTGYVIDGESLIGSDSAAPGGGSLFWIEFLITALPNPGDTLTSTIGLATSADTYQLDPDLVQIPGVDITTGICAYSLAWSPPPNVVFHINPSSNVFPAGSTNYVGTTFTVDVMLAQTDGWFIGAVSTHLTYNSAYLQVNSVVFDPLWGTTDTTGSVAGDLVLDASSPSSVPSGDVVIAAVTFQILAQPQTPPDPVTMTFDSPLHFVNFGATSTFPLTVTAIANDGSFSVGSYVVLVPAHLEVSSASMGPGPVVGQTFDVTVSMVDLQAGWNLIGVQYRVGYDASLIEPVAVSEGPYLPYFAAQEPGSLGTFFVSFFDPSNVLIGGMVFPDSNGVWHAPLPGVNPPANTEPGTGVLATITFRVIYQSFGEPDITSALHLYDVLFVGLDNLVDQNIVTVPNAPSVDGTYTITSNLPGREIDLYGGAVNNGYGMLPFPAPYGGQGQGMPMDLVFPQSWVQLYANVTYNYWPVQHKLVGFEVQMPNGTVYDKFFAFTDANGVATVGFRMPWPCDNPESLFGVWTVTSTVSIGDVVISDVMPYKYDYLIHITKVTTDKFQYNHGETVSISIEYTTVSMQTYPVLFVISIHDELGVTVGTAYLSTTVGGVLQWCTTNTYDATLTITLPKYAYAGIATITVNAFDKEPVDGGVPVTPVFTPYPTIAIQPY